MRTLKEIETNLDNMDGLEDYELYYHSFMLEIMCNIALTLDKLYIYAKEINDEE